MAEAPRVEGSLYSVLNVPQNASEEEIHSAYRKLSLLFHPDKHSSGSDDGQRRQSAATEFERIKYAYEVLSDRPRRDIYDLYGPEGLEADWEVLPRVATGLEMLEVYDRLKRLRQEEYVQRLSKPCGKAVMKWDARGIGQALTDMTAFRDENVDDENDEVDEEDNEYEYDDDDEDEEEEEEEEGSLLEEILRRSAASGGGYFDGATGLPMRLQGLAMEERLDVPLSPYDTLSYSCQIETVGKLRGWGCAGATFRHMLSSTATATRSVHAGFQVGRVPQLSAGGHLVLPALCFAYADVAWRPWSSTPTRLLPRVHIGRQFTSNVIGRLEFEQREEGSAAGEQSVRLVVQRDNYYGDMRCHLTLGVNRPPRVCLRYQPKLLPGLDGLASVDVAVDQVRAAVGLEQAISPMTRLGMKVQLSFPGGIELSLRCQRGDQRILFPMIISDEISATGILYCTLVPLAAFFLLRECVIRPYARRCAEEEARLRSALLQSELAKKRKDNESFVQLMTETYQISVDGEKARRGLVIRNAWFGQLASSTDDDDDGYTASANEKSAVVDVTVALQCLVKESHLILYDTDKSSLPGFYDPAPQQTKALRVRYEFRGLLHEVTVQDTDPLQLPKQSHAL